MKISDKNLEQYCRKYFQKIDVKNPNEKILGLSYYYARKKKKLKDYQSRSFASELTAFLTGEIIDTNVSLVYREEWLDTHLYSKYEECDNLSDFIEYMIKFYKSSTSWKYERVGKHFQVRVTQKEKEMLNMIPAKKQVDKFNWLLKNYDYSLKEIELNRGNLPIDKTFSINLCTSQYECLMSVIGDTKTKKFLNILYYGYSRYLHLNE